MITYKSCPQCSKEVDVREIECKPHQGFTLSCCQNFIIMKRSEDGGLTYGKDLKYLVPKGMYPLYFQLEEDSDLLSFGGYIYYKDYDKPFTIAKKLKPID